LELAHFTLKNDYNVVKIIYVSVMLCLNGFELGPCFNWDTVYIIAFHHRSGSQFLYVEFHGWLKAYLFKQTFDCSHSLTLLCAVFLITFVCISVQYKFTYDMIGYYYRLLRQRASNTILYSLQT